MNEHKKKYQGANKSRKPLNSRNSWEILREIKYSRRIWWRPRQIRTWSFVMLYLGAIEEACFNPPLSLPDIFPGPLNADQSARFRAVTDSLNENGSQCFLLGLEGTWKTNLYNAFADGQSRRVSALCRLLPQLLWDYAFKVWNSFDLRWRKYLPH